LPPLPPPLGGPVTIYKEMMIAEALDNIAEEIDLSGELVKNMKFEEIKN